MFLEYVARFLVGGLLVCLFALIAQICQPKQFAGIFSAAPSILLAGLAIILYTRGTAQATKTAEGAIAGAIGLVSYCLVATPFIRRHKVITGSLLSLSSWFLVSFSAFTLMSTTLHW